MADSPAPLLTLDTLTARPVVVIDGHRYEMRAAEECSLLDLQRVRAQARRLHEVVTAEEPTEAEIDEAAQTADRLCRWLLVDVPDVVHQRFRADHRLALIETFSHLLRARRRPAEEMAPAPAATGGSASPGSSGSTAAAP